MIIQLRGTSGSGKTTAMRQVIGVGPEWTARFSEGRRKPVYYVRDQAAVMGHYSSPCGGCDTFKNYGQLKDALKSAAREVSLILMEGLMLSDDVLQTVEIHETIMPVHRIYYLNTPLDVCIERVKGRRVAKGKDTVFNEEKLKNRHAQIERTRPRLESAGIECRLISPSQAVRYLSEYLRENAR
jgi:hypothetical protein